MTKTYERRGQGSTIKTISVPIDEIEIFDEVARLQRSQGSSMSAFCVEIIKKYHKENIESKKSQQKIKNFFKR